MSHFAGGDAASTSPGAVGQQSRSATVNTVLGPVPADQLGPVAVHEALLSVLPGAEYAPDISMDRAEIFETLAAKLTEFHRHGGRTVVDSTGMFHGRDLPLYEALSRSTGVHIVASTGMGPEEMLGGYFLTPQTNPPTPWPADKFADLFTREAIDGMVIPRLERRAAAGLVATAADRAGMTPTEESLFRGAARTAQAAGIPVSIRFGADALHDLDVVLEEGLAADRVLVGGLDRRDAVEAGAPLEVARRGAYVVLDRVGTNGEDAYVDDSRRAGLVQEMVNAGYAAQILLSGGSVGVAKGHPGYDLPFSYVLSTFVPFLHSQGLGEEVTRQFLVDNPRVLLSVRGAVPAPAAAGV
ncbi:phosphotriesterase [Arthrobacter sp. YD2]|uniref:phosphotriesterase family protein n=1 Tax=Arthrobacter sp. YD2 TaxID=3058046 RepID=UPI0025B43931|nr:phosphotriesterase [Arthrobacter sp. YD2]MDN3904725.1 phosphotriesterase [Arthrobacter sp. YD2]